MVAEVTRRRDPVTWDDARREMRRLLGPLAIGRWDYADDERCLEAIYILLSKFPGEWAQLLSSRDLVAPKAHVLALTRWWRYRQPWWQKLLWLSPKTFDDFYQQAYAELRLRQSEDMHLLCRG